MTAVVEVTGVRKRFGGVQALTGVDVVAEHGQVLALLGPNGAGKTTLVRMLATLVRPDTGAVRVAGIDAVAQPEQVRQIIGLAGQYAIIDRFRSLPMPRSAVLAGRALAQSATTALTLTATALVALAVGFRPGAGVAGLAALLASAWSSASPSPGCSSRWGWPPRTYRPPRDWASW